MSYHARLPAKLCFYPKSAQRIERQRLEQFDLLDKPYSGPSWISRPAEVSSSCLIRCAPGKDTELAMEPTYAPVETKHAVIRIWERAKQGASLNLFGLRLFVTVRRANARRSNRWKLLRNKFRRLGHGKENVEHPSAATTASILTRPTMGLAVIVGVGDGLGASLVKHLSDSGMNVAAVSRDPGNLRELMRAKGWSSKNVKLFACDATHQASSDNALDCICMELGVPDLVIYLVQSSVAGTCMEIEPTALEDTWRANCLGAFIIARKTASLMAGRQSGTIIFAGATSAIIGRPRYLSLAVGKFALRALSQVMARELWPHGIHVAHVVIDGGSFYFGKDRDEPGTDPEAAAEAFLMLHRQPKNSWTHELDLRPWNERFWRHC